MKLINNCLRKADLASLYFFNFDKISRVLRNFLIGPISRVE